MAAERDHPQELQLALMRSAAGPPGPRIADDLERDRELWSSAMLTRSDAPGGFGSLIPLRDLSRGLWNADTLYVLSSGVDDPALERLAQRWEPDEVTWIEAAEASNLLGSSRAARILRVWWD
jgi:hypothetical protein